MRNPIDQFSLENQLGKKPTPYIEPKEAVSEDSKTIEQAAKDYAQKYRYIVEDKSWSQSKIDDFTEGTNWQKEQSKAKQESHNKLLEALILVRENKFAINDYHETIENAKKYAEK